MVRPEIRTAALSQISQERWVRLHLMKRRERIPMELSPIRVHHDVIWPVAKKLDDNYGSVVLFEDLIPALDIAEGENGYPVLWSIVKRMKPRLNQPVHTALHMGYALGVKKLDLTVAQAEVLQVLRDNKGKRMFAKDIVGELEDEVDERKIYMARSNIKKLKHKAGHNKTYRILRTRRGYEYTELI